MSKLKPVVSEDRRLNLDFDRLSPSPILGDVELKKVINSSKAWPELVEGLGGWGGEKL